VYGRLSEPDRDQNSLGLALLLITESRFINVTHSLSWDQWDILFNESKVTM
jgi:hypothetical protein